MSCITYLTQYVEKTTGVKIQVNGVDFRPMRSLVLDDVLVRDFRNDTLLYCEELCLKVDSFHLWNRTFTIEEILFNKAVFHLWVQEGTNYTNIEILLDSLTRNSPPKETEEKQGTWWVDLKKISLRDSRFTYREEIYEPLEYGVNWTDVDCRHLNVDVTHLDFNSPMYMEVAHLNFVEKSGLVVKNMSGKVQAGADNLLITDCHFEMERSNVELMKLEYNWVPGQHDWKYFTTRMKQYYELGPSSVSFIDLAYFNEVLRGITNTVKFSGVVSNTVKHLEGDHLYFELGDGSVFQGCFKSIGLPDVWNTVFHIELSSAHFRPEDLASVYLPWFSMNIPVPKPLYHLPYLDFEQICFDGTLSDFMVYAKSVTPELGGDLNFAYTPCKNGDPECVDMRGDFDFRRVHFGKLMQMSWLGYGGIKGKYTGQWDENGPDFQLNSRLNYLNINKNPIHDLSLDFMYENEQLNLLATVEDPLLEGEGIVSYDMNDTLRFLSTKGRIHCFDLKALGFGWKTDRETFGVNFDFVRAEQTARSFSNLTLTDLAYTNENGSFLIEDICLEDNSNQGYNTTTLKSDIFDLAIDGNFRDIRPIPFIWGVIRNYLPAYTLNGKKTLKQGKEDLKQIDFEYAVDIKDMNRVLDVLYPGLNISSGSQITSFFHQGEERLNLTLSADTIGYRNLTMFNAKVTLFGDIESLDLNYSADKITIGNDYQLFNLQNQLSLVDNHLDNRIRWSNWGTTTYSGDLSASIIFKPDDKSDYVTDIQIHPGVIVMDDSVWKVNSSHFRLQGKELDIRDFSIRRGDEYLSVYGKISEDSKASLSIKLENFDLEYLNRIALDQQLALFGITTGTLVLQDYYNDFILLTDFQVENWGIQQDTLGTLHFRSYWDAESRRLMMGMENQIGEEMPLVVDGYYVPAMDSLHVDLKLKEVGLERLEPYLSDLFSDVNGNFSGNLSVRGTSKKPDISGLIRLDSVGMKVNLLNTKFFIHDSIYIDQSQLLFHDFSIKDNNGQQAVWNGAYQILDHRYKLQSKFERFLVLNTTPADHEAFYGQMKLSGLAELDNMNETMNVVVNARTEENSQLYLPLTAELTERSNNFLHFTTSNRFVNQEIKKENVISDIHFNANLEVNDHLKVQVIFDPTVGDILKTQGNGNIRIAFDQDGSLSLFGEYQITKGDYLFTLSNLVNKKFVLTPGGTINWSGSPYEAILDIDAVYSLKTSITELLALESGLSGEENTTETGRKVPVECILNLSENLTNPTVKFDIDFPTLETQSKSYIQSLFSSQDEINKQMFSLLVLNRFYRTDDVGDYGIQAQTAGVTTLTEMFTNQISRWFSKYSDNVDIGLAYRFGDRENEMTSDELEVAVSTQLLNDRVTISANGNMDVGGNRQTIDNRKTNIAGDFDVEVKLNKQGSLKMKAYSHTDEKLLYNNTETIQGVGVSYQESFDTFRELLQKYFGFLYRKRRK